MSTLRKWGQVSPKKYVTAFLIISFFYTPIAPVFGAPSTEVNTAEQEISTDAPSETENLGSPEGVSLSSSVSEGSLDVSRNQFSNGHYNDVDQLTGTYNFEIPIVIPPGRNGMQPQLGLQYNSQPQTETSVVGYGWNLPIPFIERINRRGADRMFSDTDFYSSLTGELASTSATAYRSKVDTGEFVIYEFSGNKWTATTSQGVVYKFGYSSTTRQDHPSNQATTSKWLLEEMRDRNGNFVTYTYYKNGGQIYPEKITYTHSTSTTGIFEISFTRESRTDTATSSASGFQVVTRERIAEIITKVNGTWARKYKLEYTNPEHRYRSLLSSVTEYGRADDGSTTTKPAYRFNYQESGQKGWATDTGWVPPVYFAESTYISLGTLIGDVNADGRPDLLHSLLDTGGVNEKGVYVNTGSASSSGWALHAGWTYPWGPYFTENDTVNPFFIADLNADGYDDFIYNGTSSRYVYINTKQGWATSTTQWVLPTSFKNSSGTVSARVVDVNGDGLPDILKSDTNGNIRESYLNNGSGWATSTVWLSPQNFASSTIDLGVIFIELNGDGLPDILRSYRDTTKTPEELVNIAYLNTGAGWATSTHWATSTSWSNSDYAEIITDNRDKGFRIGELNGDGSHDLIRGYSEYDVGGFINTYLNTRSGWETVQPEWNFPSAVGDTTGADNASRILDINGDMLADLMASRKGILEPDGVRVDFNTSKPVDVLSQIAFPQGGTTTIEYKSSHLYASGTTMLNTKLPYPVLTVSTTTERDGQGTVSVTTHSYEGGIMYWNSPYDRKFAGFNSVTKRDPDGNVTKTYFHQGSSTESSLGEYNDHVSKIGKPYRIEQYGTSSNLYTVTINTWDKIDLGNGRNFVKLNGRLSLNYEGDTDHRDILETYTYATSTGNVLEKTDWGEVVGSTTGAYTDTGTDKFITTYAYATNTTFNIYALPSRETVWDQSGGKVRESRFYYDTLTLGNVTSGNLTKHEMWQTGTTYIDTEKTYNAFGLVATERDPRDKTTTYTYDTYNLYPATTTNPVSHTVGRVFDYSSGKVRVLVDQDKRGYETTYDGFDRVLEEKQPDQTTPTTLVTKATFVYTDTGYPTKVQATQYLTSGTSTDSYVYFDGFGKKIEERAEAEGSNTYAVKTFVYNKLGLLQRESLPYFSSSTAYTGSNTPPASPLLVSYLYDPLGRVRTVANTVGTTSNEYDDWVATTTDSLGNQKSFTKDARGNLIKVLERNGSASYITTYEYNGNNKLTKITDADANVRNFTYDGLGRRLTAQDLHDAADLTYGTWTFTYDSAGNIATTTDPKSQVIGYSYDNLNRVLTENYTGTAGMEISYAYDTCTNGKGRLCAATTTRSITRYTYNPLGLIANEVKIINGAPYTTAYTYDRLGNKSTIVYPNNVEAEYVFNAAGQLETVRRRESGGSFTPVVTNFNYGPHGQVTLQVYGNGATTTRAYNENELYRLSSITTIASSTPFGMGGGGSALLALEDGLGLNSDLTPFSESISEMTVFTSTTTELVPVLDIGTEEIIDATTSAVSGTTSEEIQESSSVAGVLLEGVAPTSTGATFEIPTEEPTTTLRILVATTTTTTISLIPLLQGKSASEKATIKGQEIAKATFAPREQIGAYTIEIVSIEPIEKGVTVYARVFEHGQQIGFGRDGAVDIERFIFINPPILVPDPNGDIVRTYTNASTGEIETYTYREDAHEALLQALQETVSVKKEKYGPDTIKRGTIGRTTTTVYPDADPETTSVDGLSAYDGSSSAWATIQGAADGGNANDSGSLTNHVYVAQISPQYWLYRAFYLFDTSSIPDDNVASSAMFSLYINTSGVKTFNTGSNKYISLVSSTPAVSTAITTADYDQVGSTKLANDLNVASLTTGAYNTWTMNAVGTSSISTTGTTKLALRHGQDLMNESPANVGENGITGAKWADETGTTQDPKLVIEHAYATPTPTTTPTGNAQSLTYTYDTVGNITNITDRAVTGLGRVTTYTYDTIYRLLSASTTQASSTPYKHTFAYSPIGNLTAMATSGATTTYTYSEINYTNPHAPTQIGGTTLTYDRNGNATTSGIYKHTYDYRNRLATTTTGYSTTSYAYDHTYERIQKTTGTSTTYYPNDLYQKEGATTTVFIYGNGTLLATIEGSGQSTTTQYYHQDHLGGTNVVTDSMGMVVQTLDYYPFGDIRTQSGALALKRAYIGELQDLETELNYLNARYYDNNRGQFLTQDPMFWSESINLGNPQSFNSYSYAENNPINRKDPSGLLTTAERKKLETRIKLLELQIKVINLQIQLLDKAITGVESFNDPVKGAKIVADPKTTIATKGTAIAGMALSTYGGGAERAAIVEGTKTIWTIGKVRSSIKNAFQHFTEHGADFNAQNAVDYVRQTRDFLFNPPSGTKTIIRTNGDQVLYNEGSNTFGVMTSDGTPKTFFKPDPAKHGYSTNLDYFYAQQ